MLHTIQKISTKCKWLAVDLYDSVSDVVGEYVGVEKKDRLREGLRAVVVVAVGVGCFGLGLLSSGREGGAATGAPHTLALDTSHRVPYIEEVQNSGLSPHPLALSAAARVDTSKGSIVASRKGKKYHGVWCSGARTIAEKNKRYFATADAAQKAGYTRASNCPGLK
jgi:hypothetical protein